MQSNFSIHEEKSLNVRVIKQRLPCLDQISGPTVVGPMYDWLRGRGFRWSVLNGNKALPLLASSHIT